MLLVSWFKVSFMTLIFCNASIYVRYISFCYLELVLNYSVMIWVSFAYFWVFYEYLIRCTRGVELAYLLYIILTLYTLQVVNRGVNLMFITLGFWPGVRIKTRNKKLHNERSLQHLDLICCSYIYSVFVFIKEQNVSDLL